MYTIIVLFKFNIHLSCYLCGLYIIYIIIYTFKWLLSINDITILIYNLKIKNHNVLKKSSDTLSTYIGWFGTQLVKNIFNEMTKCLLAFLQ